MPKSSRGSCSGLPINEVFTSSTWNLALLGYPIACRLNKTGLPTARQPVGRKDFVNTDIVAPKHCVCIFKIFIIKCTKMLYQK